MSGAETDERTILNYLNHDCWHAVLDYVPLEDILRTETASQEWQKAMLTYLRSIRIDIETTPQFRMSYRRVNEPVWCNFSKNIIKTKLCRPRLTRLRRWEFESWTYKLGPSVAAAYCDSVDGWKMYENCPNLETLMLINLLEGTILSIQSENFMWLKRLAFKNCKFISDRCVSRFMVNNTVEQLQIDANSKVTGKFLINKKSTKLKFLALKSCSNISLSHLLEAGDYLSELRKLDLSVSTAIYKDIHLLMDKMPKLEHVKMLGATLDGCNFFEAVCRLKHLKNLCVDFYASEADLEAVTRCCPELQALTIRFVDAVSPRVLAAACAHAGSRLVALGLACRRSTQYQCHQRTLTDDHIVACIRACPNLKMINVRGNRWLTRALIPRVAAVRREMRAQRPLTLRCGSLCYHSSFVDQHYEELLIRS